MSNFSKTPHVRLKLKRRRELAAKFGWRCWYCGVRLHLDSGHLDHVIPTAAGGPNIFSNWALTCNFCNMAKQNYSLDEFMEWLEWVRSGKSFTPYNMDCDAIKTAIRNELGDPDWEPAPIPSGQEQFKNKS